MKGFIIFCFLLIQFFVTAQSELPASKKDTTITHKGIHYTKDEILKSVKESNLHGKSLNSIGYPEMSYCGGGLKGYYYNSELKILKSTYGAEFGYQSITAYFKDSSVIKIISVQHNPDYDAYSLKYPKKKEIDAELLTYTHIETTILLTEVPEIKSKKNGVSVKGIYKNSDLENDLECIHSMMLELRSVTER